MSCSSPSRNSPASRTALTSSFNSARTATGTASSNDCPLISSPKPSNCRSEALDSSIRFSSSRTRTPSTILSNSACCWSSCRSDCSPCSAQQRCSSASATTNRPRNSNAQPITAKIRISNRATMLEITFTEAVAHTTYRLKVAGRRAKLVAKSAHMGIHRARVDVGFITPHVAKQLFAILHTPAPTSQS